MTLSSNGKSTKSPQQTDDTILLTAIANLTRSVEELKVQNMEALQQNKELKTYIRQQLSATPLMVKQMLNDFIAQFKEALEQQKSDKLSDTILELISTMKNLSVKLEDTNLVQMQVNEQAMEAYEEIISSKKHLI